MQMTLTTYLATKAALRSRCVALRAAHPGVPVRDLPEPDYQTWCSLQQELDALDDAQIVDDECA